MKKNAKDSIYNNPNLFKDILIEWAEENDTKALKVIYDNPFSFNEIIIKWAISGNVEARNFILKHSYYLINEWTDSLINDDVKDTMIGWANESDFQAKEIIYQNPVRFSDSIIRWTNNGDARAKALILKHPEHPQFKVYIGYWERLEKQKG